MEMDNALKLGYKFKVLWGYTFDKDNVFNDYVDFLYNLRSQYPKSDPMNFIAKILLNSLYGRFGMDDRFSEINVIHKDYYADFENKFLNYILETIDLGDYKLVIYKNLDNQMDYEEGTYNISISIAAFYNGLCKNSYE
jgi:DNA polymerase type B, organellar and viral